MSCISEIFPQKYFLFLSKYFFQKQARNKKYFCGKTCLSDLSLKNTFCVSVGKPLWKPHDMSINGFFQKKQPVIVRLRFTFFSKGIDINQ